MEVIGFIIGAVIFVLLAVWLQNRGL